MLTKENLGQVKLDGAETVLFDKTGKQLCIIRVDASNTRQGKYEPFNVQQKEQADAYNAFLKTFAGEINAASGC